MKKSFLATVLVFFTVCDIPIVEARRGAFGAALSRAIARSQIGSESSQPDLSYDQVYTCLKGDAELQAEEIALEAGKSEVREKEVSLQGIEAGLAALEAEINRLSELGTYTQSEIDEHNRLVDEYDNTFASYEAAYDAYEASYTEVNRQLEAFNARADDWNSSCYAKSHYEDDYDRAVLALENQSAFGE